MHNHERSHLMKSATNLALVMASLLTIIKFAAWIYSGSLTILTSMVDSIFDVTASAINSVAARYSLKPADEDHRFGHGKAEAIASFTQSLICAVISLFLMVEGIIRIFRPEELSNEVLSMAVMAVSLVVTLIIVSYQKSIIKRTGSLIIKSDLNHYLGDLLGSGAALVSLALYHFADIKWADSITAIIISAIMLKSSIGIFLESLDHLMDKELSEPERHKISKIALSHPEIKSIIELKTRKSGGDIIILLHVEMAGNLPLHTAVQATKEIEREIHSGFGEAVVTVKIESAAI